MYPHTEVKQELDDMMTDIKKTANRVRAKLKGKECKRSFLFAKKMYHMSSSIGSPHPFILHPSIQVKSYQSSDLLAYTTGVYLTCSNTPLSQHLKLTLGGKSSAGVH